jgi:hypothetical protein
VTNEEIIRGAYAAGKKRITCPVCNGGEGREEDTMGVWVSPDYVLRGWCYRATCDARVHVSDGELRLPVAGPAFEPKPLRAPYRRVTAKDYWGKQWLDYSYESEFYQDMSKAAERGLRVLIDNPDTAVWRLRALDGTLVGHITRTKDKTIRTYKDLDRALYYYNGSVVCSESMFVFEDPMSAALCPLPACALLGTSIPDGLVKDLADWRADSVLVCLDPGAEDAAMKVYNKLTQAGVPATFVPMSKDYKDMTLEERKELEETYA